ncbi:hypothetical protein GCM10008110_14050 [Marinobacter persicus]|nr:hypothetical protein GCM10008110_14050 [Marinobacter persicus]
MGITSDTLSHLRMTGRYSNNFFIPKKGLTGTPETLVPAKLGEFGVAPVNPNANKALIWNQEQ